MVAQYVFFRDTTGKLANRERGKHVPTHLLAEMGKCSILRKDGTIAWRGWGVKDIALFSSFVIRYPDGGELNYHDTERLIWKALADAAKIAVGKPLNANEVLAAADSHAAAFFRQKPKNQILVAGLSITAFPAKKIRIRGCEITPLARRGQRFPLPQVLQSAQHRNHFANHLKNSGYRLVKVACSGRTMHETVGNTLDGLNLLRALWSVGATLGRERILPVHGPRRPIGVIHTGAVYTLHNSDGSAADDNVYWFDPDYIRDQELIKDDDKWKEVEKDRRWAMRKIASLPYKRDFEDILLRYIAALDQANPNVAFLQLWSILEKITDTVAQDTTKPLIERAGCSPRAIAR